eukprot:COSAG05_NODE_833_length_7066_cov_45.021961_4_plen_63_part_00
MGDISIRVQSVVVSKHCAMVVVVFTVLQRNRQDAHETLNLNRCDISVPSCKIVLCVRVVVTI